METDPLTSAREALAAGDAASAIDRAWRAVRPAVVAQDTRRIQLTGQFAQEVAARGDPRAAADAEQLAAYCAACLLKPREENLSFWAPQRLFGWLGAGRKKCPDCAESIQAEARVCRYCGYRYPDQSS